MIARRLIGSLCTRLQGSGVIAVGLLIGLGVGISSALVNLDYLGLYLFWLVIMILFITLQLFAKRRHFTSVDIFHPHTVIIIMVSYLYGVPLCIHGLSSGNYALLGYSISSNDLIKGLLWLTVALGCYLYGFNLLEIERRNGTTVIMDRELSDRKLTLWSSALTWIGLVAFIVVIQHLGNLTNIFNNYYQVKQILQGSQYLVWASQLFVLSPILQLLRESPNLKLTSLQLLVGAGLLTAIGSRADVVYYLLLYFVVYHRVIKRISMIKSLPLLLAIVIGSGIMYVVRVVSAKGLSIDNVESFWGVWNSGSEFSMFSMYLLILKDSGRLFPFHFGKDFLDLFVSFIPRGVWPDKPVAIDEQLLNVYFPYRQAGIPGTLIGTLYYNFSYYGIIIGMFCIGILSKLAYFKWVLSARRKSVSIYYAIFFVFLANYIRGGDIMLSGMFALKILIPVIVIFKFSRQKAGDNYESKGFSRNSQLEW